MTDTSSQVEIAYEAIKHGDKAYARQILQELLLADPDDRGLESAWYLYAHIAESREEAVYCLQKVLELNPRNERAIQELKKIKVSEPQTPIRADGQHLESALPPKNNSQSQTNKQEPENRNTRSDSLLKNPILWLGCGTVLLVLILGAAYLFLNLPILASTASPINTPVSIFTMTPGSDCSCDKVNAYIDRTGQRYTSLEQDATYIDGAFQNDTIAQLDFAILSGKARTTYKEQVADTPPLCLQTFHSKTVALFWNWQQSMEYLASGQYEAAQVFIDGFAEQASALEAEGQKLRDTLQGCPGPGNGNSEPSF